MFKLEKKNYGVLLTFDGFIQKDEMEKWVSESKKIIPTLGSAFGIVVDMRNLKPLPADSQQLMEEGQKLFKKNGMQRSAVVLNSPILTMQFKRIAKDTGIQAWERYIDASKTANWEAVSTNWVQKGVDPDQT